MLKLEQNLLCWHFSVFKEVLPLPATQAFRISVKSFFHPQILSFKNPCCGSGICTHDLQVMGLATYYWSIPLLFKLTKLRKNFKWARQDSNLKPSACKADALPLSYAPFVPGVGIEPTPRPYESPALPLSYPGSLFFD